MSQQRRNRRDYLRGLGEHRAIGLPPISPSLAHAMNAQAQPPGGEPQNLGAMPVHELTVTSETDPPAVHIAIPVGGGNAIRMNFATEVSVAKLIEALQTHRDRAWPRVAASQESLLVVRGPADLDTTGPTNGSFLPPLRPLPESEPLPEWTCNCGYVNCGPVCSHCGYAPPSTDA